ncbi:LOW QUALITY PROTEIN: hypothetical protein Cgig2_006431 [Carnegiea gigantea]|uniref:Uncharacterized protein n=1 Tax=Carnegiea gigantea TaxID=171969 RepID=A0A9Q1GP58_9CARY|nr:LOW QUALITY PROTEIN: hypothetical protein Cgig2_006431 [Carnegiea gigantea]
MALEEGVTSPPLLEDYRDLCPGFTLPDVEEAAHDFNIPKIVQAMFCAILVNNAVELSVGDGRGLEVDPQGSAVDYLRLHRRTPSGGGLRSANDREESSGSNNTPPPLRERERERESKCDIYRESHFGLYIMVFPYFLSTEQVADYVKVTFMWCWREHIRPPQPLPEDYCGLSPYFDLNVVEAAQRCHGARSMANTLTSVLKCLNWGVFEFWLEMKGEVLRKVHIQRLAYPGADPEPVGGQEENSGSSDAPPPSSDEE